MKWEWDDDGDEPGGGGSESRISLRVEKRWLGDDPAERPSSVELWLLRDGALWEQVILTEDDHWVPDMEWLGAGTSLAGNGAGGAGGVHRVRVPAEGAVRRDQLRGSGRRGACAAGGPAAPDRAALVARNPIGGVGTFAATESL